MENDWFDDPNFDPDDFASSLFGIDSQDDTDGTSPTPTATISNNGDVSTISTTVESREHPYGGNDNQESSHFLQGNGSSAVDVDGRYSNRPTAKHPATERATTNAREQERIQRARGVVERLATDDGGSNNQGRYDTRTTRAVEYARANLKQQNTNSDTATDKGLTTFKKDYTKRGLIRPPQFTKCTFRGTFYKMQTVGNGEWMLQIRCLYEDGDEIKKLDKSAGMVLKITVERNPVENS